MNIKKKDNKSEKTGDLAEILLVCSAGNDDVEAQDRKKIQDRTKVQGEVLREAGEAAEVIRSYGWRAEIIAGADESSLSLVPEANHVLEANLPSGIPENTLFLCDSGSMARTLRKQGAAVAGWSHAGNRGESFRGIGYVLEEPQLVDRDSYEKIWQRERGLPWTILETDRCLVREFTEEDMEAIQALYDEEVRRWLEAPTGHTERERAILRAYIERVYGLYGFGHWAVILKETGELIGRMGYAVPRQDEGGIFDSETGILGYLIGAPWRRRGLTEEVCRALIRYGREQLGFVRIVAEVNKENTASRRFLEKLGFEELAIPVNRRGESTYLLK